MKKMLGRFFAVIALSLLISIGTIALLVNQNIVTVKAFCYNSSYYKGQDTAALANESPVPEKAGEGPVTRAIPAPSSVPFDPSYPYKKVNILTDAEYRFYGTLKDSVDDDYKLLEKVRLIDVINAYGDGDLYGFESKIMAKHCDFVIADSKFSPLLVIELNDRSHNRVDRQERDQFVEKALYQAGIPILFVKVTANYNANELRQQIDSLIKGEAQ